MATQSRDKLNVLPLFAVDNIADMRRVNTKLQGYLCLRNAAPVHGSYFPNKFLGKFGIVALFTNHKRAVDRFVAGIFGSSSPLQIAGVVVCSVAVKVATLIPRLARATKCLRNQSMHCLHLSGTATASIIKINHAVAVCNTLGKDATFAGGRSPIATDDLAGQTSHQPCVGNFINALIVKYGAPLQCL